jgi:hypothetical protein
MSASLPKFVTVAVFGLSLLVAPTCPLAKLSAAPVAFTFTMRLLDQSGMKTFPLAWAATPKTEVASVSPGT